MRLRLPAFALATVALLAVGVMPELHPASATGSHPNATIPLVRLGDVNGCSTVNPIYFAKCDLSELFEDFLLKFGPNGSIEPNLATSWGQANPVTYVYHLRHGVKFWDGNEMTSADVANSLNYERGPGSEASSLLVDVRNVKATSRYTVVVTLRHPDAGWKYELANLGWIFEKKFEEEHPTTMGDPGVLIQATGPWKVDSLDPATGMQLSANPHWWGGKVPVRHISVSIFSSETSEALAMRAGEIDVAFPLNGPPFASTSGGTLLAWPAANDIGLFAMNTRLKPWSDVHVRRAVAYALNRTDVITADGGLISAGPDSTLISPQELRLLGSQSHVNGLLKSIPQYPFNLKKAKQEMAESGYPKGFTTTTETRNFGGWVNICEVIAAELAKIGIKMKVDVVPSETWLTDIFGPRTYGNVFTYWGAGNPDPGAEPGSLLGSENMKIGGGDLANYDPKSVDELLARGDATSKPSARLAIYGDLLKKLATDEPYVPLFNINIFVALGSKFTLPTSVRNQYEAHVFADWPFLIKPVA